jgi:uncharacterized protein (TIGR02391 family)
MTALIDYVPTLEQLAALNPEDLGMVLVQLMQASREPNYTESHFIYPIINRNTPEYPEQKRNTVREVIREAWQWLLNEGLLVEVPEMNQRYMLTRKGKSIKTQTDIDAYRLGNILPIGLLEPTLAEKVRPMFMRGDYDVAVLQAFKTVEMAVRKAAGLSDSDIGRKLMQSAFRPEGGPLITIGTDKGEQVGLMELFSGAIGYCKNPASHRSPGYNHVEAAQLIAFASFLLKQVEEIVDSQG